LSEVGSPKQEHYLLPTAYYLLLTAYCLLPTAYYLLPHAVPAKPAKLGKLYQKTLAGTGYEWHRGCKNRRLLVKTGF